MTLTQTALDKIKNQDVRRELSGELKCTDQTISRYIKLNENNGPLTTAGAIKVIRDMTGLVDGEILEAEVASVDGVVTESQNK